MRPCLHLRNLLFYSRSASSSSSTIHTRGSKAAPCPRFFCSSLNVPQEAEHIGDLTVEKLTRQVSRAIQYGLEDVAVERLHFFQSVEPSVVFCNYVLNTCARAGNSQVARHVWAHMVERGVAMNEVSHGCYLRALCRDKHLDEAVSLLEALERGRGIVVPNIIMCNIVLNGCVLSKSKPNAERCLQLMSRSGIERDEMTYVELMKLAGLQKDITEIWKLWEELTMICEPSPSSRCVLIVALCRARSVTEAMVAMKDMSDAVAENRVSTRLPGKRAATIAGVHDSLTSIDNETRAEGVSTKGNKEWGEAVFKRLKHVDRDLESFEAWEVRKELQDSLNSVINVAGISGKHFVAEFLFAEMRRLGLRLSVYTYNALLRAVVKGRGVAHGLRIIRSMEATAIKPDTCTYTALVEGFCHEGQLDKAEALLLRMAESKPGQRPSRVTYNILLKACGAMADPERALRIFARMKGTNVSPDICTYIALLGSCGTGNGPQSRDNRWSRQEVSRRLHAIETDMARSGIRHTRESISALMKVLGDEGMLEVMMQRLRAFSNFPDNDFSSHLLDATSYNTAMHGCIKAQQFDAAWDIYGEMKALGIAPNCETFNVLIDACSYKRSLSEAFGLVDAMHREGIQPDIVTYNSLIKVTCHAEELDVSLEILCKMRSHGIDPDVRTYNTILSSAAHHKRLDLTEFLIEDMRLGGIRPDNHSCLHVVGAYVNCGQDENAAEALRVVSSRMLPQEAQEETPGSECSETAGLELDRDLLEHISLEDPVNQALFISRLAELAHGGMPPGHRKVVLGPLVYASNMKGGIDLESTMKCLPSSHDVSVATDACWGLCCLSLPLQRLRVFVTCVLVESGFWIFMRKQKGHTILSATAPGLCRHPSLGMAKRIFGVERYPKLLGRVITGPAPAQGIFRTFRITRVVDTALCAFEVRTSKRFEVVTSCFPSKVLRRQVRESGNSDHARRGWVRVGGGVILSEPWSMPLIPHHSQIPVPVPLPISLPLDLLEANRTPKATHLDVHPDSGIRCIMRLSALLFELLNAIA